MDRPQLVRRGDEEHVREVQRNLEVVIAERVILRGVQHLEQRGRGVALDADRDLVDLVEHEDRIRRLRRLERLDDPPGHGADVGAAVSADLGLVAHAAQRDAHELAVHRSRDGLAEGGLAHAGGTDEAENRPLHVPLELAHGEVLDNAFLDLVEVVVILVEHATRLDRVEPIFRPLVPGDVEHPVQVRPDHLVFGGRRRHPLETIDLARGDRCHGLRQVRVGDALAELLDFGVALAELRLNRLHLLPQHVLPLGVGHLLLGLGLDLALQLEHVDFARERRRDGVELDDHVVFFQQPLLVLGLHVDQAGQQVRDAQRIVDVADERAEVGREAGGQRQRAVHELLQPPHPCIDLERGGDRLRQRLDQRGEVAALALQELRADTRHPFDEHTHAGRGLRHLTDDGDRADAMQVVGARLFVVVLLEQRQDHPIARERAIDGFDGQTTADTERRDGHGQHERATKRHDGKFRRKRGSLSLRCISHRYCQQSSVFLLSSRHEPRSENVTG